MLGKPVTVVATTRGRMRGDHSLNHPRELAGRNYIPPV